VFSARKIDRHDFYLEGTRGWEFFTTARNSTCHYFIGVVFIMSIRLTNSHCNSLNMMGS